MKRCRKKDFLSMAAAMEEINDSVCNVIQKNPQDLTEMLIQCQDIAMQMGTNLEHMGEQFAVIVKLLEDYCENIYQISISLTDENVCRKLVRKIRKQLVELRNHIQYELPEDRKEVVFLPYKAAMWDSLESVWKIAEADENTDVYVIPIPYYDKNPDESFRKEYYEGELYPSYVPITKYDEYDFEERRPDAIFIHNAYDGCNRMTSVHPFFYSKNLKKFTDKLVYIPYFVLGEIKPDDKIAAEGIKHLCILPGVFHADKVIVQSEDMKQVYINLLTEEMVKNNNGGNEQAIRNYWENKIDGSGSPKFDKVLNLKKDELDIPTDWLRIIKKPDGSWKKIVFYNTTITALWQYNEQIISKMENVFRIFKEHQDEIALLWRPHPLMESSIISMRPHLLEEYKRVRSKYIKDGWGIYDDTPDVDRAIVLCDAYFGDTSSLVHMYQKTGKPLMVQDMDVLYSDNK